MNVEKPTANRDGKMFHFSEKSVLRNKIFFPDSLNVESFTYHIYT